MRFEVLLRKATQRLPPTTLYRLGHERPFLFYHNLRASVLAGEADALPVSLALCARCQSWRDPPSTQPTRAPTTD